MIIVMGCANAQSVGVDEFARGLGNDEVQLLDVRTPEEFAEGYISGAMLADINDEPEFNRRVAALDKEKPIYVYCLGGGRSADAAALLSERGFQNVVDLKGGITAWSKAGKPVVGLSYTPAISPEAYHELTRSSDFVLVAFSAKWCPPCRKMAPVLAAINDEYFQQNSPNYIRLETIDASTQPALMEQTEVAQMPTYILYRDGQEVWRATGVLSEEEFRQNLEQHRAN